MALWQVGREDLRSFLLIALLPLLVAAPLWMGFLSSDPSLYAANATVHASIDLRDGAWLPGNPVVDNNNGQQTQALGYLAARELLHGRMPWWNAYTGVGLPLAAEYQPAAFFPPTLLLLLPHGMLWEHLLFQILAGWGTYALLRQLGLGRLAALTGGVLFAFNGTLAWFEHAAALTTPFLPWMLFGIERALAKAELGLRGGWRILAVALTLNLLAGHPEAAYVNCLMVLVWGLLRLFQSPADKRLGFVWRAGLGGVVGIALAAPQIFAFLQSLPNSISEGHNQFLPLVKLDFVNVIPSLIAPYFFGPIYGFTNGPAFITALNWTSLGGYVTAALLVVALYGLIARRDALGWLLLIWSLLALGKMFGVEPANFLWNHVPAAAEATITRIIQPTWILALVILAARGLDDLVHPGRSRDVALWGSGLLALIVFGGSWLVGAKFFAVVRALPGIGDWAATSSIWALLSALICLALLAWPTRRWTVHALAILLMAESAVMFVVPTLSNPSTNAKVDMPAIKFLRANLGLDRMYTLGPIKPNYGAYYGIASINQTYVPLVERWPDWVHAHLDSGADAATFVDGVGRDSTKPGASQELHQNLAAFEWIGTKYLVTYPLDTSFLKDVPTNTVPVLAPSSLAPSAKVSWRAVKKVYGDTVMDIYQFPHPSPYFEIVAGRCNVAPRGRTDVAVDCATPSTLLRRELFYPGWRAKINGSGVSIAPYKDLFQSLSLPQGKSIVRFRYAPPHIIWMWLIFLMGVAGLVASGLIEWRVNRGVKPFGAGAA